MVVSSWSFGLSTGGCPTLLMAGKLPGKASCDAPSPMSRRSYPAGGRRAPPKSTMEMDKIFLQLCEEVTRLQDLCAKQGKLLQKLTARKGPVLDIPMSLPVQCTEDMATEEGERPPGSPQKCSEAPEGSAHPLVQPHAADVPGFDSSYPPSAPNGSVFDGGAGRAALAVAFGSNKAERSEEMDLDTWLKNCRMLPIMNSPEAEVRACRSPQELVAPNAEAVDSFLTLLDLYKGPEALQKEDAPSESAPAAEEKVPVEIRGPMKTSWTPGWMLEDAPLGQGDVLTSEAAQTYDICQAIFPSDATAQADYLKQVLTHMK